MLEVFELSQHVLDTLSKLKQHQRKVVLGTIGKVEFDRCAEDVLYWLDSTRHGGVPYVYTIDPKPLYVCGMCDPDLAYGKFNFDAHLRVVHQADLTPKEVLANFTSLPAIRPFPLKPYMKPLIDIWMTEQFVAIEKSRDMMATWLMVVLYTWDTFFHKGRQNLFMSREATKTRDIIKRAIFVINHMPDWLVGEHKAFYTQGQNKAGQIEIPTMESEILGFPQGPDQIRTYHPTGVFMDEAAFQEQAGAAYASIKPAIQDGGRISLISSSNPSFFQRICRDDLDEDDQ